MARPSGSGSRPSDQTPSGSDASRVDPSRSAAGASRLTETQKLANLRDSILNDPDATESGKWLADYITDKCDVPLPDRELTAEDEAMVDRALARFRRLAELGDQLKKPSTLPEGHCRLCGRNDKPECQTPTGADACMAQVESDQFGVG